MKLLVTDGGPHPADKWADTTASEICALIQIEDNSDSIEAMNSRIGKRDLEQRLFAYFMAHHTRVQGDERLLLQKIGMEHAESPLDPVQHLQSEPDALDPELAAIFAGSSFAEHFGKPEVINVVNKIIVQHTGDVMHIERRWHADRLAQKGN